MIVSALKKLLNTLVHFRKRVSVEEQCAQKYIRFLRGRQIAYTSISVQPELMKQYKDSQICSLLDNVQDFDVRWDQAPLSASEIPTDVILEGLYRS